MTFYIDFLGCKVNSYEAQAVAYSLIKHDFIEVDIKQEIPDIIIINTCAVTEVSATKSRHLIKRFRTHYPNSIIIVMGCYSQYAYELITNEIGVDIVIGTSYRDKIYELIDEFLKNKKKICLINKDRRSLTYENLLIDRYFENTRAYVKIQDGCNNFCTYCLIPYIRGISRSRSESEIINEIKCLINNGYKEIILTGIDQGSYGLDFKEKSNFSTLLSNILKIDNLYRIRISSIEESQIDNQFLELLNNYPNIANHLHIPLQSGSKDILKAMNRKYDVDSFLKTIEKIREIRPDISITTDVIVGFPGESEENFIETYNFIKKAKFSKIHVFPYSDRAGTIASKKTNKVPIKVKKERVQKLLVLNNELEENYFSKFYGKKIEFLIESFNPKTNMIKGHSSNYLQIEIPGKKEDKGTIKEVIFTKENKKDI